MPAAVKNLDGAKDFPQALAAFLALLGMGAVIHVLLLSGRRWRKDLAVLRSLGMVRRQAARCITVQAAALGAVAVLIGVPVGIAAGRWAWTFMARSLDVVQQPIVPVAVAVLAPAAVVAVVLASVVPAARAARLAPAVVLRSE
jgi:ABC-type antimicrobial peptide transport system permease subunit